MRACLLACVLACVLPHMLFNSDTLLGNLGGIDRRNGFLNVLQHPGHMQPLAILKTFIPGGPHALVCATLTEVTTRFDNARLYHVEFVKGLSGYR